MKILGFKLVFGHRRDKKTLHVTDDCITVKGDGVDKIFKPVTPMAIGIDVTDGSESIQNVVILKPRLVVPVEVHGYGFTEDCQIYMGDGIECKMARFGAGKGMSNPTRLIADVIVYAETSNGLKQMKIQVGNEMYSGDKFINPDIIIRVIEARPNTVTS